MTDNKNKGIRSGSGSGTIRAFRSPYANAEPHGLHADDSAKKKEEPKPAEKPEAKKETPAEKKQEPKASPAPSIKKAVEQRRGSGKPAGSKGKKNSWRKASDVYAKGEAEYAAEKAKKLRDRRTRNAVTAVLLILVTAGALIGSYFLSLVKNINVTECTRYTKNDILNAAGVTPGKCILAYSMDSIKTRLEKDPYLEVLSVKRVWPNEIDIEVDERIEYAAITTGGGTYCVMDKHGYILYTGRRDDVSALKSVYGLGTMGFTTGTYIDADKSKLRPYVLMELIEAFGQRDAEIASIDLTIPASLKLGTADGYTVMLGDSVEIEAKVGRMFAALDKARESGSPNKTIYVNSSGSIDLGGSGAPSVPTAAPSPTENASGADEPAATAPEATEAAPEDTAEATETVPAP